MLLVNGIQYLAEKEVQIQYGLSVHWLRKARYSGNGPVYYKLNDKILYTNENVDSWLKNNLKEI
jgi:hypothetical protein